MIKPGFLDKPGFCFGFVLALFYAMLAWFTYSLEIGVCENPCSLAF